MLLIESRFGRTLLTGDIERVAELQLQAANAAIDNVDVLLVPHHGSRSSSTAGFLERINPRLALVSAGHRNRFNHPHPEIVKRYQLRGVTLMNSAESGWIRVVLDRQGLSAIPYRSEYRRYWLPTPPAETVRPIHLPPRDF